MSVLRRYFQENASKVLPQRFGELSVETLNTLVLERHLRGFANKDDQSLLQEALMFQRALTGDNSVEVAQCHERLADLFREQGRYQEAEKEAKHKQRQLATVAGVKLPEHLPRLVGVGLLEGWYIKEYHSGHEHERHLIWGCCLTRCVAEWSELRKCDRRTHWE